MTKLNRSYDGRAPDPHLMKEITSLDSGLVARFFRWIPDQFGYPLEVRMNEGLSDQLEAIEMPRWYLYCMDNDGIPHLILRVEEEDGSYRPFDRRVYTRLLADDLRHNTISEMFNQRRQAAEDRKKKVKEMSKARHAEWAYENKKKIGEVVADPTGRRRTHRDKKIVSYKGQGNSRGTSNDSIALTSEEQGYKSVNLEDE